MSLKSMELAPTKENILNALSENLIGRNINVWQFARFCDAIDDKCSIALDAQWGYGKTFFIKQTQMLLEAFNPHIQSLSKEEIEKVKKAFSSLIGSGNNKVEFDPQVCVYFDAWENDNDIDPILSLVYSIAQNTETGYSLTTTPGLGGTLAALLDSFSGKNFARIVEMLKETDTLAPIKGQKEITDLVKEFLDSLLEEKGNRLVVFVDEMDRCRPSYAVQFLERIKHYFENDRITFVFSVNIDELQNTIRQFYGNEFNASRYLDKFFDYRITLPPANLKRYYQKLDLSYEHEAVDSVCKAFINCYSLGLREIEKYYRMTKIIIKNRRFDNYNMLGGSGNAYKISMHTILPIIIGLKMIDANLCNSFIQGLNPKPLVDVILNTDYPEGFCYALLNSDEGFEDAPYSTGSNTVSLKDKIIEFYSCFNKPTPNNEKYAVGQCSFTQDIKKQILEIASIISGAAIYE